MPWLKSMKTTYCGINSVYTLSARPQKIIRICKEPWIKVKIDLYPVILCKFLNKLYLKMYSLTGKN